MYFLAVLFWILLFAVYYAAIEYVLFKGKQYNRFFATFLNTIIPVVGSVPVYVMACKYEKRILGTNNKINNNILKCVTASLQMLSVLFLFFPLYSSEPKSITGINLIFGTGQELRSMIFLIYIILFPIVSAVLNFVLKKSNISNFITYSVSLLNIITLQFLSAVISSNGAELNAFGVLYCILNTAIMLISIVSMVALRDKALFILEYKEKIEYIKKQQSKIDENTQIMPDNNTYKCAKCGNLVLKGTICSCIENKSSSLDNPSEKSSSGLYCVYCKKPLEDGQKCNCQGDGFGIVVKSDVSERSKNRKCIYCGQVLVGESTCVCEKIMKNSVPASSEDDQDTMSKAYFKSHVEKGSTKVNDELNELEKKINQRFEKVKESMGAGASQE